MAALRRLSFVFGAVALAVGLGAAGPVPAPDDMVLGNPKAKVTVVEYASLSCSHCAAFNNDVFPAFKAKYIDTGKVRYVYREFLTEPVDVAATAALIARCAGPKRYFDVTAAFYRSQPEMYRTGDARAALLGAGKAGGLDEKRVEACVADKAAQAALSARVKRYIEVEKIAATPTFVINGKVLKGDHDLKALDAAISPLLRR